MEISCVKVPNNPYIYFHLVVVADPVIGGPVVVVPVVAGPVVVVLQLVVLLGHHWVLEFELEHFGRLKSLVQLRLPKAEGMAGGRQESLETFQAADHIVVPAI